MRLKTLTDSACGSGKVTALSYAYDEHGDVVSVSYSGYRTGKFSQEIDNEGYVTKTVYQKGIGETQEYSYLYEKYGNTTGNRIPNAPLTKLYLPTGKKIKYEYDSLNRLKEKGIVTDTAEYYSELYTYGEGGYHEESVTGVFRGPSATTIKPDRETTFVSEVEFRGLSITDKYEYDLHGNISKKVTGGKEIRYTYDDIDRLVREDNAALNKTYFYEYDDFGNIEKITTYNYTTGNSLTGDVTKTYAYDSSKRLISVTENGVTQNIGGYDALGNPASYKGKTLTWTRGRMLASCGSNSYLYDMDGVRQEKTVNGVTHTYYTDGTKIIAEKVGEKVFEYYYDLQGVVGFKYDGNVYYYKKNLMGDIDRIYDANKNLVAEYKYDAWGNHRVYTSGGIDITENVSYNNSIAKLNPFRYRGYYYDTETGLYYLNSRYYDPSVGRFINADDISYIQPTDINGLNLFAYCGNNPVMYTDPSGCAWWDWVIAISTVVVSAVAAVVTAGTSLVLTGALAGIAVGGAVSIANQVATTGDLDITHFTTDIINGALSGALAATGVGVLGQIAGNAAFSLGTNLLYSGLTGTKITAQSITESFVVGFVSGLAGWNGAQYIGKAIVSLAEKYMVKVLFNGKLMGALMASSLVSLINTFGKAIGKLFKKG